MHDIYHLLTIDKRQSKVFEAVTVPSMLNKWWTVKSAGKPEIGEEYTFWFAPEYDWKARVVKVSEPNLIIYKIISADQDWKNTILKFDIEEIEKEKTTLKFYHLDWKVANDHFGRTNYCWAMYLNSMKLLLEKGN